MTANLKIGPCPKCGNTTFITTAHVTQTWLVDEDGDFIEAKSDCDEVTHAPDAEDLFTCSKCGAGFRQNMHTANNFANTFAKPFVHTIVKKQA